MSRIHRKGSAGSAGQPGKNIIHLTFLPLLIIAVLAKGLFFENQFLPYSAGVFGLLFILLIFRKVDFGFTLTESLVFLFAMVYLVGAFIGVSPRSAYVQFLKQFLYFAIFYLAVKGAREVNKKNLLLLFILASISTSTLITLLDSLKLFYFPGTSSEYRLASTIQYANAYAGILIAAVLIATYFYLINLSDAKKRGIYAVIWLFNTIALYGTGSRSGFLVYIVTLALTFALIPAPYRLVTFINNVVINLLAIGSVPYILQRDTFFGLLALIVSSLSVVIFQNYVVSKLFNLQLNIRMKKRLILAGVLFVLIFLVVVINFGNLPIMNRIFKITQIQNLSERFYFFEDAWKIFKGHWLLGIGGGGWGAYYRTIQSYLYDSTEIHSNLVQTFVETGIIGGLLFLVILILAFKQVYQKIKNRELISVFVGLSIFGLIAHSFIDWDFSIPAYCITFYALLGLLFSDYDGRFILNRKAFRWCLISVLAIALISSTALTAGHFYVDKYINVLKGPIKPEDLNKYISAFEAANRLDFMNPDYLDLLGQLTLVKGNLIKDTKLVENGLSTLRDAAKWDPFNYKRYFTLGKSMQSIGRYDKAFQAYEELIRVMPMSYTGYEALITAYTEYASVTQDEQYLHKAIEVHERTKKQMELVKPELLRYWHGDYLDKGRYVNFQAGIASILLGRYEDGEMFLEAATSSNNNKEKPDQQLIEAISDWNKIKDYLKNGQSLKDLDNLYDDQLTARVASFLQANK